MLDTCAGSIMAAQVAFIRAEPGWRQTGIRFKAECTAWTLGHTQPAANAALIVHSAALSCIVTHGDFRRAVRRTDATLNAARRVCQNMIGGWCPVGRLECQCEHIPEQAARLVIARQALDGAMGTCLDAFSTAATCMRHEYVALLFAHRAEWTDADACRIRTVLANVRHLVVTKMRASHCHARASMPIPARGHAGSAVDALGQIADQNLSHRLFDFPAGPVALVTVLDIANPSLGMHLFHLGLVVVVAVVATIRRIVDGMAGLAGRFFSFVAVIQGKVMSYQTRRSPACRRVTRRAIRAELPAVYCRIGVALDTFARCTTESAVDVTLDARHSSVLELERKDGGVIKSLQAITSVMARKTRCSHGSPMVGNKAGILTLVTIDASPQQRRLFSITL